MYHDRLLQGDIYGQTQKVQKHLEYNSDIYKQQTKDSINLGRHFRINDFDIRRICEKLKGKGF